MIAIPPTPSRHAAVRHVAEMFLQRLFDDLAADIVDAMGCDQATAVAKLEPHLTRLINKLPLEPNR